MSSVVESLGRELPCSAHYFDVAGGPAFFFAPTRRAGGPVPWVWYAPTFMGGNPKTENAWMFRLLLEGGVAVAGVEVGESYGNPEGRRIFSALYAALRADHAVADRAALMPQSRGGLMLYNWAAENPTAVACVAGIFPVCDLRSYPGLATACGAYGMNEAGLASHLAEHNPIDRLRPLARAGVPIMHVHGDSDPAVPYEPNSGEAVRRYRAMGGSIVVEKVVGGGHEAGGPFYSSETAVDFLLA